MFLLASDEYPGLLCLLKDSNLAAASLLKKREVELPGTVVILFQPAEEGGAGAKMMINEGAVDGVSAAFAIHVWPYIQSGHLLSKVCSTHPWVLNQSSSF